MITLTQPIQDERPQFAEPLEAIQRAAEAVAEASLPELLAQVDATYAFMAEQFIPDAQAEEQATGTRLIRKLQALRERLVYTDFGPPEQSALRNVLGDLHELVGIHAFKGSAGAAGGTAMIRVARATVGDRTPLPLPSAASMTSLGSYYLRSRLYQAQGSPAAGVGRPKEEALDPRNPA